MGPAVHLEVDDRIVGHWPDVAPGEVDAASTDAEAVRAATAAEAPRSTERARAVGRRFAQLVG